MAEGNRRDGEGGGLLGYMQGNGTRIVIAGYDGISLVFETPIA
jgi:ribosome assembly protein SQT1